MGLRVSYLIGAFPNRSEYPLLLEMASMQALGVEARVLALSAHDGALPRELETLLPAVHPLRNESWLDRTATGWDVIKTRRLRRQLSAWRPDLLHAQFGHLGFLAAPVAARLGIPLVVSFRGQDVALVGDEAPAARRRFFERAALVLARSQAMRQDLLELGCPAEKIAVHASGIPVADIPFAERRMPASVEEVVLLAVGRLAPKKGMLDAVRALAFGWPGDSGPRLRIAGWGEDRWLIEQTVQQAGLGARVTLLGALAHEQVIAEMLGAHLFLLPCRRGIDGDREGIPNAIKEAMATGLPVVSTRHGGIPECVEEGVSGLLAAEGNIGEIASGLEELLTHPERWAAMGRRGREIVQQHYDIKTLAPALVTHYHAVVGREAVKTPPGTSVPSA